MVPEDIERFGIASGGNWIVDRVKMIDRLPSRGMLANISSERFSSGGAPANVLGDLARLKAPFPLCGVGVVGGDEDGRYIVRSFRELGVDVSQIATTTAAPTSYTDVMTEEATGARSFFHHRGANALFGPEHVTVAALTGRIFHLGYVLLLDRMDQPDDEYGTVAARLLCALQEAGIKTSLDLVSEESDRYARLVPPALRYVDYLVLNEVEAARVAGSDVRGADDKLDGPALVGAVDRIFEMGSQELVAVHMPEGAYIKHRAGECVSRGSLRLPEGFIKGAVGAGDAFCAGMLYGLHEDWALAECVYLGGCCAAASLSAPGATDGVGALDEVKALGEQFGEGEPPVSV